MGGNINQSTGDRVFNGIIVAFVGLMTIIVLYPLLFVVSASISDPAEVLRGRMWLIPTGVNIEAYKRVLANEDIGMGFVNSTIYTVIGTLLSLALTTIAAYVLSRKDLPGKKWINLFFIFTMFFSGGIIPTYLVINGLGMYNTIWAMTIPGCVSVFNLIIMRSYMEGNIPEELYEAAYMDGCGNIRSLFQIVLPLSGSIIAVMILFYGVNYWNEFFKALIYLKDRKLYPLQLVLREILLQSEVSAMTELSESSADKVLMAESIKYASVVVSSAPLLIIFPFMQKSFEKGVMVGAVKG